MFCFMEKRGLRWELLIYKTPFSSVLPRGSMSESLRTAANDTSGTGFPLLREVTHKRSEPFESLYVIPGQWSCIPWQKFQLSVALLLLSWITSIAPFSLSFLKQEVSRNPGSCSSLYLGKTTGCLPKEGRLNWQVPAEHPVYSLSPRILLYELLDFFIWNRNRQFLWGQTWWSRSRSRGRRLLGLCQCFYLFYYLRATRGGILSPWKKSSSTFVTFTCSICLLSLSMTVSGSANCIPDSRSVILKVFTVFIYLLPLHSTLSGMVTVYTWSYLNCPLRLSVLSLNWELYSWSAQAEISSVCPWGCLYNRPR